MIIYHGLDAFKGAGSACTNWFHSITAKIEQKTNSQNANRRNLKIRLGDFSISINFSYVEGSRYFNLDSKIE